ncbi:MAG: 30S ribosome-binding factor RbfA [Acidobacteriota bacterium]
MHFRRQRLGDQLQVELAEVILLELKDPRIGFVTVTEVRMSTDLKHARVYVSVYGTQEEEEETLRVLRHAGGFLKRQVGRRLALRYIPDLVFVLDDTLKRSARIEALLENAGSAKDE